MTNPKDAKEKGAPAVLWGLICLLDCAWELRWKASSQKRRLLTRADFPLPSTVGLRLGSAERERAEERARFWDLIVEAAGKDRNARLDLHEVCKLVEAVWQDLTREVREDERFEDVDCDWAKRPPPGPQGDNWKDRYADYLGLRDSIVEYRGKLKAILRRWKAIRERKQGPPKTRAEFLGRKLGPPSLRGMFLLHGRLLTLRFNRRPRRAARRLPSGGRQQSRRAGENRS